MATRKRPANKSNQESQQTLDVKAETVQEDIATEQIQQDAKVEESPVHASDNSQAEELGPAKAELETTSAQLKSDKSQAEDIGSVKAELEATIAELRNALEQAHQREGSLLQHISDLQGELYEQKTLVQKLRQDIQQASLKSELDQVKKTALELADANSKLIEEMNVLKNETKEKEKEKEKEREKEREKSRVIVPKKGGYKLEKLPLTQAGEPSKNNDSMWLLD